MIDWILSALALLIWGGICGAGAWFWSSVRTETRILTALAKASRHE
jgi:hypothetical protein